MRASRSARRCTGSSASCGPTRPGSPAEALAPLVEARAALDRRRGAAEQVFVDERRRVSAAIRVAIADPRFHEAVLWQNRRAYDAGFAQLLREKPGDASSRARQKE